jgi:hypothetical protein
MIPLLAQGDSITAAEMNSVAAALDAGLAALFGGHSPLIYLPLTGSPSWRESRLSGIMLLFGNPASRRILASVPSHDQASLDSIAAGAAILPGPGSIDHTLKQVTLNLGAHVFDTSLKAQKRPVANAEGDPEDYWVRVQSLSVGATQYYDFERHREYAVADIVFEGFSPRTWVWDPSWDKFGCVRFHNLDPNETPLTITLPGLAPFELKRWECFSCRRTKDWSSFEKQGFLLFRAREDDVQRFGGTFAWNGKIRADPQAAPWQFLDDSDAANNVACWELLPFTIDYFSIVSSPALLDFGPGGGLVDAFERRTGLFFNAARCMPPTPQCPPLGDATVDETKLWRLLIFGGDCVVARHFIPPDETEPVWQTLPATLDLDAMQLPEGDLATGLKLEAEDYQLTLTVTDPVPPLLADLVPIAENLVGSSPASIPPEGLEIFSPGGATNPQFTGYPVAATNTEFVAGHVSDVTHDHQILSAVAFDFPGSVTPFNTTIGGVKANMGTPPTSAHVSFPRWALGWDGRNLAGEAEVVLQPVGEGVPDANLWFHLDQKGVLNSNTSVLWPQQGLVQRGPSFGGVWFLPERARRAWANYDTNLIAHPMLQNYLGDALGGDWRAARTTTAPLTRVRTYDNATRPVRPLYGVAMHLAADDLDAFAAHASDPAWWEANRDAALGGGGIPDITRPAIGIGLMSEHYNVIAARLNALAEVGPFSFLDVIWYGQPFQPGQRSGDGVDGGSVYPGDFLCDAPTGSETAQRASTLGIPIREFATVFPSIAALVDQPVEIKTTGGIDPAPGPTTYLAFAHFNLLNDLLLFWRPERQIAYGMTVESINDDVDPGAPWFPGERDPTLSPGLFQRWWGVSNPEAVVPTLRWVNLADVQDTAEDLGLPFRFLRFSLGLKVRVIQADETEPGGFLASHQNLLSSRTEVWLVPDSAAQPQFARFVGVSDLWAQDGIARVAEWRPVPSPLFTAVPEVVEQIGALDQGICRESPYNEIRVTPFQRLVATNPTHQVPDWPNWWHNGSYWSEAPRLYYSSVDTTVLPPGWTRQPNRIWVTPSVAIAWGTSDVEVSAKPSGVSTWVPAASLPSPASPSDLNAATGGGTWAGKGAFIVAPWPGGLKPT